MNFISAQGYIPIRGAGMEARATQQGLVCLACFSNELNRVVDADLNNSANIGNLISSFGFAQPQIFTSELRCKTILSPKIFGSDTFAIIVLEINRKKTNLIILFFI